jgi:predicted phosphodiesterase
MRYGIIADIHGNLEALEAVLHSLSKERIDQYLQVGDIVGYGADPSKCIKIVQKMPCVGVAGNHDWAVSDLFDPINFNEVAREAVLWTEAVLSWEEIGYLKSLDLVMEKETFTLVHGTLDSPGDFNYIFDERDARATFRLVRTPVCYIGHSHVAGIFQLSGGVIRHRRELKIKIGCDDNYIVNVGSVGQPRDGDPRASYVIYDDEQRAVEIRRVEYDIKRAQDKILKAGLPSVLANRLSVGG